MVEFLSRMRAGHVRSLLGQSSRALVEIVYPKTCAGCGARGTWLCDYCDASEPGMVESICDRCGISRRVGEGCWCGRLSSDLERARSVREFGGWSRSMVHRTKYGEESARAAWMAQRMVPLVATFGRVDALVPVPLHRSKLQERGYNQAALLADEIGAVTGIPVRPMLVRIKATTPQVALSAAERATNVGDAFALNPAWQPQRGQRYLLIDDVRTSGATINACAKVLTQTPGVRVAVLTFAVAR